MTNLKQIEKQINGDLRQIERKIEKKYKMGTYQNGEDGQIITWVMIRGEILNSVHINTFDPELDQAAAIDIVSKRLNKKIRQRYGIDKLTINYFERQ